MMKSACFFIVLLASYTFPTSIHSQNLLQMPESVVYDSLYDRYLVSNWLTGSIMAVDNEGSQSYFVMNQHCHNGLHINGTTVYAAGIEQGVRGFDLDTGGLVFHVDIPGMINLNDITSDNSGNLYVSDVDTNIIYKIRNIIVLLKWRDWDNPASTQAVKHPWSRGCLNPDIKEFITIDEIFSKHYNVTKIHIADSSYSSFVTTPIQRPNGVHYDERNNRLLVVYYNISSPIQAVSLVDSSVSTIVYTGQHYLDGITEDNYGNIYFSAWTSHSVFRYDSTFANPPELIWNNPVGAADIFYDKVNDILALPIQGYNTLVLLPMFVPILYIDSQAIIDNGNNDGRADPGETCQLYLIIGNEEQGEPAVNAECEISSDDPAVNISSSTCYFDEILPGSLVMNVLQPFVFSVGQTEPHFAEFMLTIRCELDTVELPFQVMLGRNDILLVDDDGGDNYQEYYLDSFEALGIQADVLDASETMVTASELQRYDAVIWETGNAVTTLTGNEQASIQGFLDMGGNLILSSTNAGQNIGTLPFYSDYLKAEFAAASVSNQLLCDK